jgi:uncharacterized damage-inducible protein DinB
MDNHQELVSTLRASREAFLTEALQVPVDLVTRRPTLDEWAVLEVVAHMTDVDYHWLEQALSMRDKPDHLFVPFDDGLWKANHPSILDTPWHEVIRAIEASHEKVLTSLIRMTDEELTRPGRHPRGIPYTVKDVFLRYPAHDENHTGQIREILRRIGSEA